MNRHFLFIFLLISTLLAAVPVDVGVYVLNAGKFDPQSGGYSVDFYLSMKCPENCSGDFEFVNGRATTIDRIIDSPDEKFYRIQAQLQNPVDFRRYPFDTHTLTIALEHKTQTIEELEYRAVQNESGLSDSIQFVGWTIRRWDATVVPSYYPIYNETYSRYVFSIQLQREGLSAFLKTFLPVLVILALNFFTHVPDPDKITHRITLHTSFVIATVMFHVAVGNQLPPLGYLTLADKFMFAAYGALGMSLLSAIVLLELMELKKEKWVQIVHRWSGPMSFAIWVALMAVVWLTR